LYGPPGTGKSSLIAAMANYLKFDVFDLELSSIYENAQLKSILLSTTNRSILVIEDIDCSSAEVVDREADEYQEYEEGYYGRVRCFEFLYSFERIYWFLVLTMVLSLPCR